MTKCCNNEELHIHEHSQSDSGKLNILEKILNLIGIIVLVITLIFDKGSFVDNKFLLSYLYVVSYSMISYKIVISGIKNIFKYKGLDENFLMTIATIGSIILGDYFEATMVILLYKIGEFLQDLAVDKSTKKIEKAIDIREEYANIKMENRIERVRSITLKKGDIIVVKNGEKVPIDGKLLSLESTVDNSLITGESKPINLKKGDNIISGCINLSNVIEIEVLKEYKESTVSKIVEFIENAGKNKSKTEKFITKFSKIYTPIVISIAILIIIFLPMVFDIGFREAVYRGLIFLVISCPCALVISIPLGFFIGIGQSSKKGVVIKGSSYLDILSNINVVAFDKTGTLTNGSFKISKISNKSDMSDEEFLEVISYAEYYSNHYLAKSILKANDINIDKERITDYREISGKGVECNVDVKHVIVGSRKFIESRKINVISDDNELGTKVFLAIDNEYKGYIVLSDEVKENSKLTIESLKNNNIKTIILTGDNEKEAKKVADLLNVDEVYSKLLPEQKAMKIQDLKKQGKKVAFVGDGINDSPVIAASDVGIAMGNGADISVEVANIIIMNDDPKSILDSILISKQTKRIIKQNIVFSLTVKLLFLVLSSLGFTSMWFAIFADVGVALTTVINSFRISKK